MPVTILNTGNFNTGGSTTATASLAMSTASAEDIIGVVYPPFGCQAGAAHTDMVGAGITPMRAFRGYTGAWNTYGVPTSWPYSSWSPIPAGVDTPVISFNLDPSAGTYLTYDSALTTFASLVPSNAYLSINHEAETGLHGYTPTEVTTSTAHWYSVLKAANPSLQFGQVFTCDSTFSGSAHAYPLGQWVVAGMDWYGLDVYDYYATSQLGTQATFDVVVARGVSAVTAVQSGKPFLIAETNSAYPLVHDYRTQWFIDAWAWCIANNYKALCPFWDTTSGDENYWGDNTSATLTELLAINAQSNG